MYNIINYSHWKIRDYFLLICASPSCPPKCFFLYDFYRVVFNWGRWDRGLKGTTIFFIPPTCVLFLSTLDFGQELCIAILYPEPKLSMFESISVCLCVKHYPIVFCSCNTVFKTGQSRDYFKSSKTFHLPFLNLCTGSFLSWSFWRRFLLALCLSWTNFVILKDREKIK